MASFLVSRSFEFLPKKIVSVYIDEYMALCLVLMISSFDLCLVWTHAELWRFEQQVKIDGTLSFLVLGDWGRKDAFKVALQVQPTSLFYFLIYIMFLYVCARVKEELKKMMQHVTDISIFWRAFLQLIPTYDLRGYRWEGLKRSWTWILH